MIRDFENPEKENAQILGVFLFDMWGILFVAGDDVTEDGFEGVYCFACGEVGEQNLGFLSQAFHGAECVVDAPSRFANSTNWLISSSLSSCLCANLFISSHSGNSFLPRA